MRILGVVIFLSCCGSILQAQSAPSTQPWWQGGGGGFRRPTTNPDAKKLPLISVKGNHFVDPQGNVVLFRGVSISDPDKIDGQGHWNKEHFQHIKEMGATLVRIPVHPIAW